MFEAGWLFKNGGGMIYALSSHDFPFFKMEIHETLRAYSIIWILIGKQEQF